MFGNINEIKPDRIQLRPPTDNDVPWREHTPSLTHTYDFDNFVEAALFAVYVDNLVEDFDEVVVKQTVIGRSVSITIEPVNADYLANAVYEIAARIDATIEAMHGNRFEEDLFLFEDFDDLDDLDFLDDPED